MGAFYGADVTELRTFAQLAEASSRQLQETIARVSAELGVVPWHGPDGSQFTAAWQSQHRVTLQTAQLGLAQVASTIRANADQQESSSSDSGGTAGGPGGGDRSGGGDGDKPEPDPYDDMGDDYVDITTPIPLDDDALDPQNIRQGQLGDCWFLAALGSVADADPDFIRDHMTQNDDGSWTVTMYDDGKPVEIHVDATALPGAVKGVDGNFNFATIYEKAAAEFFGGSYEDIDGGFSDDAFAAITGGDSDRGGESDFDGIRDKMEDGPIAVGTEDDDARWWWDDEVDNNHIVPNHAYMVDTIETHVNDATGEEETMIHLLNPWGPNGGNLAGDTPGDNGENQRWGDIWLTEDEYKENFDSVYSGSIDKK
jgi:hypothetical protein